MKSDFETILRDLKNKVYHPVYFFYGLETYYIDSLSDYITSHVLDEMSREFNQTVIYGKETDITSIISAAKRYPMMSNFQVVVVKEAQDLKVFSKKEKEKADLDKKDEASLLAAYLQKPQPSTLLVFCHKHKTLDGRTKLAKEIEKHSQFFESKPIYDNQVGAWVTKYLRERHYKIEEKAAYLIGEFLGTELSKISNELDKLLLNVKQETTINIKHIEDSIGINREYTNFELTAALGTKNVLKANRIVNYFSANPKNNPIVVTMGTLYSFFNKMMIYHTLPDRTNRNAVAAELGVVPYFLGDYESACRNYNASKTEKIISLLREYDLKTKGVNNNSTPHGELLRELVFKILH